jgi:hypothetical protein
LWHLRYYPTISLEGLRKITVAVNQSSWTLSEPRLELGTYQMCIRSANHSSSTLYWMCYHQRVLQIETASTSKFPFFLFSISDTVACLVVYFVMERWIPHCYLHLVFFWHRKNKLRTFLARTLIVALWNASGEPL